MHPITRWLATALLVAAPLTFGCQGTSERVEAPVEAPAGEAPGEGQSAEAPPAPEAMDMNQAKSLAGGSSRLMQARSPMRQRAAAPDESRADEAEARQDAQAGMYIIRKASVTVQVKEVREGMRHVARIAQEAGGFVADSAFDTSEGSTPSATLTLRVPAKRFDGLLDSLGGLGTVFSRNIESEDVTLNFVDTQSRIRNLRKEEALLLKMLDRSGKLTDVLAVERELSRVSGEIEQAQGRLRHLANQVDLATITVTLSEKVQTVSTSPWAVLPASVENALANAQRDLANTAATTVQATIQFVLYVLPIAAVLGLLLGGLGLALRGWLVDRRGWVSATAYNRAWVATAIVVALAWVEALRGWFLLFAVTVLSLWAVSAIVSWFGGRRRSLD